MRLPVIEGIIRRRILINYRMDPEVIQNILPPRFRPKLHAGYAIAGICLIRLEHMHPKMTPAVLNTSSENAAHRIAVLWDDETGVTHEGVFIPRRDTDSRINHMLGGRLFPGEHQRADFKVAETENEIALSMKSHDGTVTVHVNAKASQELPGDSIFRSLPEASAFFQCGSLGYSLTHDSRRLDGLRLEMKVWQVEPLEVRQVYSSYFTDEWRFPRGAVEFDHALILRNAGHEWHSVEDLYI